MSWEEDDLAQKRKNNPDFAKRNPHERVETRANSVKAAPVEFQPTKASANKFHAIKTAYGGFIYDSKKEAEFAKELDLRKKAGEIMAWFPHVRFDLGSNIWYEADFLVITPLLKAEVYDTKGYETQVWKIKRKLFESKYPIKIKEV